MSTYDHIDTAPLRVGDILYGYCGGYFGRNSYDDKRVEAIGSDWVVARGDAGDAYYANVTPSVLTCYRYDNIDPD